MTGSVIRIFTASLISWKFFIKCRAQLPVYWLFASVVQQPDLLTNQVGLEALSTSPTSYNTYYYTTSTESIASCIPVHRWVCPFLSQSTSSVRSHDFSLWLNYTPLHTTVDILVCSQCEYQLWQVALRTILQHACLLAVVRRCRRRRYAFNWKAQNSCRGWLKWREVASPQPTILTAVSELRWQQQGLRRSGCQQLQEPAMVSDCYVWFRERIYLGVFLLRDTPYEKTLEGAKCVVASPPTSECFLLWCVEHSPRSPPSKPGYGFDQHEFCL